MSLHLRTACRVWGAAAALLCAGAALAQGQVADPAQGQSADPTQGRVLADDHKAMLTPQGVANIFNQACLRSAAKAEAAVDWALGQGFEPIDALGGPGYELLEGQPGNVLTAPGSDGRVMLVVTNDLRCTVWAHQMIGPQLRLAVAETLDRVGAAGGKIVRDFVLNIDHAGAWRNQTRWRYQAEGESSEFGVSAVTTLSAGPATQALNMAPWQAPAPEVTKAR